MERRDSYEDGLAEGKRLEQLHRRPQPVSKKHPCRKLRRPRLMKTQILSIKYIHCAMLTLTGQMKIFTMH